MEDEDFINQLLDEFSGQTEETESMNVNDLNQFLTASDVEDGDKIVFTNAGKFIEKDYSQARDGSDMVTVLEIEVKLPNGKKKLTTPNNTSRKNIVEVFGPETNEWVGKAAKIEIVKQNVRGTLRDVIYLTPAKI